MIQDKALIKEMSERSKDSAKDIEDKMIRKMANNPNFNIFYGAPAAIIVSHKDEAITPVDDISVATQNILLQAESMGIGRCWNGFVYMIFRSELKEYFAKKLEIPKGYTPFHAIAVGYPKTKVVNPPERKSKYFNFIK